MSKERLEKELEYRINSPLKAIELEYGVIGAILPMLIYYMIYRNDYQSFSHVVLSVFGFFSVMYFMMAKGAINAKKKELDEFNKIQGFKQKLKETELND